MACIAFRRNRWVIDFYDQHGKRKIITLPKDTTKTEARKVLRDIETQIEKGTFISSQKMPVFSEIAEDWLAYKKPNIRESTFVQYQGHVQNHLKPYFGNTKPSRINFNAIEKYMAFKYEQGMTPPTLKKTLVTLGGILKYAVRKRYIDYNPVREIEKPRGKASEKKKIDFLTPEEIQALIENTRGQKFKVLFKLAVSTGMREGELLGLKWSDIDWLNSQVKIRRTFNHNRFYEPKTETSRRSIDLGPSIIHELKKWQLACLPNNLDLVFPNEVGKPRIAMHL